MLYTSFYSFSHMDKKFVAITASISYLGYICAIFMVFTLKKFESHWTKKGKYNYGNDNNDDNDDDNSSSDDSSVNNIKKKNNKKIKNNIKIDENLKKNLIDTNIIHKKKKSFDNNSNNEEENEEDEE